MHPNLVNYALSYAKHGFSVIPIGNNKRPLIKFADKPPLTSTEIQNIWKQFPTANIALKTDSFFVIDVDRHNNEIDGMKSIQSLNHNEWFKDTLTEKTANGGYHYYFKKPANTSINQHIGILPSVDIKAHNNNYVVVAPSQIGEKKYIWLNHTPIKEPPRELINWILEKQENNDDFKLKLSYRTNGKSKTAELFESIVNGLGTNGTRNNSLTSFVGGLLFRGVDPEITAQLALIANSNTDNPLSLKEIEKTVNSVLKDEIKRRENLNE